MKDISNIYKLYNESQNPQDLASAIECALKLISSENIFDCEKMDSGLVGEWPKGGEKEEADVVKAPEKENKPKQPKEEVEIDMVKLNKALTSSIYGDPFSQFDNWASGRSLRNMYARRTIGRYTPVENDQLDTGIEILSIYISEENEGMKPEDIKASLKDKSLPIKPIGEDSGRIIRVIDIENALKS